MAVDDYGCREFKSQQTRGVVEQTFTFEQVDNTLSQTDALGDGRCRGKPNLWRIPVDGGEAEMLTEWEGVVLAIHGGPAGVFQDTFLGRYGLYQYASFAARGYAVLRANPRGSGGYGRKFRFANMNDWGGKDFEDVMRAWIMPSRWA